MTRRMAQPDLRGPETGRPRAVRPGEGARGRPRSTGSRRRTSPPSSPCSAACCCPRTRSPTWSRCCGPTTSTGPPTRLVYDCDPRPVRPRRAGRRGHRRRPSCSAAATLVRARRRAVPAHADRHGAHRRQRRLLRRDRRRAGHPAPAGRGRHPDRAARLRHGGRQGGEVDDVVDRAQAEIYEVTERRTSEDYVALEELLQPTMDEIDAIASPRRRRARRAHRLRRPRRGHQRPAPGPDDHRRGPARDRESRRWRWISPGRAAVKHGMTSAVFSLEMSKTEITMRLLSAEARIRLADMRAGHDERRRLDPASPGG